MQENKKNIAILGSTGSIGTQALQVVDELHKKFRVSVLTANRSAELLIKQALKYKPNAVVICDEAKYDEVHAALAPHDIKVYTRPESVEQVVSLEEVDIVLTAMVGFAGLRSTIAAIKAEKTVALANKETLVVAGQLITELAREHRAKIIPVDSEHSAIFQCLQGEAHNEVEKVYLTASGGPFRGKKREELAGVTKKQALKHPNWEMGAKITIDSASMMNKGLEVIEAKWLFDLKAEQIEVVVHPQSIIHSMVAFKDGSIKAELGEADMRVPIQYAFTYPKREYNSFKRFSFLDYPELTFEEPDSETFRNLAYAFEAMNREGNAACILNAANEIAVENFLNDKIQFLDIFDINEKCLQQVEFIKKPSLEDYIETDAESREFAKSLI